MGIRIIKTGLLDTVQDGGRYGYQQYGINPGGAMDKYSMQVANALLGNELNEGVIEIHFPASVYLFESPAMISLAGADLGATINGEAVPLLRPIVVEKHDVLQFQAPLKGVRVYLAIRGGLGISKWLGSYSTNLKAMAGGFSGRALQKDDLLPLRNPDTNYGPHKVLNWIASFNFENSPPSEIRILRGNEWSWLKEEQRQMFLNGKFRIDIHSDRMGYQLGGDSIQINRSDELVSSAVSFGTIQLLPGGRPIILMADHQTTGGYPRIGHVISADHSRLAQMKAGERMGFKLVSQEEAEQLLIMQQLHLKQLQASCKLKIENYQ